MNALLILVGWGSLFLLSWPLALMVLVAWPFVWLLSLPIRLIGLAVSAALTLIKTILLLPSRLLGYKA